jgi:RHS repeat-associated protein
MFGNYVNDELQFLPQEEGRVRYNTDSTRWEYDYFLKDHLGNVRMMLTDANKSDFYPPASLESDNYVAEQAIYGGLTIGRTDRNTVSGYPTDDTYTDPNDYVQALRAEEYKIGSHITLKVTAGDKFNIRATAWYDATNNTGDDDYILNDLVLNLTSGVAGQSGGKVLQSQLSATGSSVVAGIASFLSSQDYNRSKPIASLNWILFDEQFKYVASSSGFDQVGSDEEFKELGVNDLEMVKSGYLFVYLSNASTTQYVYFDNLQVTHVRGPILEETHYYPYGLTMAGISTKALGFGEPNNKLKFNGKEEQRKEFGDGSGIEWLDFGARMFDNQIGRWLTNDPLADNRSWLTQYNYCSNNPFNNIDPKGQTDYALNKKTGYVQQIGEKNDEPDRILKTKNNGKVKTKKNGEYKVAINGIEQGILTNGMNLRDQSNLVEVGGAKQPSEKGVESFALQLSNYLGIEIKGTYFGTEKTTHMAIGKYKGNTNTSSDEPGITVGTKIGLTVSAFFHTHPSGNISVEDRTHPSDKDLEVRDQELQTDPNLKFYILTAPLSYGDPYPYKINYTTGYSYRTK